MESGKQIEMDRQDAEVIRYQPGAAEGLTEDQVLQRQRQGLRNKGGEITTKSIGRIIQDNVFTLFNLVITLLGLAVLWVGSYKNLLFMGVMACNIIIGIVQEIRTKITVDRLSILSETKASVIRGGQKRAVPIEEIVLDDIVELSAGGQVSADCILLAGECGVNESLVTGESDVLHKKQGELLLSGSFLVSGKCRARVEHVGDDNYVSTISSGAKYYKKVRSEIMESVRKIIRAVSICIVPLGILTFLNQSHMEGSTIQSAVVSTAAALIGMIPEGLVLLTSTVMAIGIIRLSKYKVMVQELYCIEALARVDVLCLDKTGTITEGSMELMETIPLNGASGQEITQVLNNFCRLSEDFSPTFQAIRTVYLNQQGEGWSLIRGIPFASETKWSGMEFDGKGAYVLGAPEFVMQGLPKDASQILNEKAQDNRVLLLAKSDTGFQGDRGLPHDLCPVAFLVIQDMIRPEAKDTLEYFAQQGVELKVISGDNPVTVSNIARRAGLKKADAYIDAAQLETPEDIEKAMETYTVFGRVTPVQKKQMVLALKKQGHTVAMTGDGVNDVLALKEADCSIAMASGSDAARNVAQLVLLDSNFAAMPQVVAEGRRSINNLQRSSSLFLVKTIFSFCLTILFLLLSKPYPFVPIQLTMISGLTIGFPSFVLALEPNRERIQGHFMRNVLSRSAPGAFSIVIGVVALTFLAPLAGLSFSQTSTLCVLLTACAGVLLIIRLSAPFNTIRSLLLGAVLAGLAIAIIFLGDFFSIAPFTKDMVLWSAGSMLVTGLLFEGFYTMMNRRKQKT